MEPASAFMSLHHHLLSSPSTQQGHFFGESFVARISAVKTLQCSTVVDSYQSGSRVADAHGPASIHATPATAGRPHQDSPPPPPEGQTPRRASAIRLVAGFVIVHARHQFRAVRAATWRSRPQRNLSFRRSKAAGERPVSRPVRA